MTKAKNTQPEKLSGTSLDITADNRANLKQLFPTVFTETKNDKGEIVESVDFEKLKAELGTFTELFESRRERYGMEWPGKKEALRLIQTPSSATLKPCREESVNFDTTENLFIEGDNLEVLKLLQKSYYGKVKIIYIDPPYNTGNEFIYPDNFSESLETYLEYAGLIDGEGKKFSTNTVNEGRFHTKWLNMMYPRLYLARNLLRDDGVIFISIDDNEVSNLRKLCDEIFGEENFIASFIREKRTNRENRKVISSRHDYLICYSKNQNLGEKPIKQQPMSEKALSNYKNPDNDPRGLWKSDPATAQSGHGTKSQFYALTAPNGNLYKLESGRCWAYTKDVMMAAIADGRIWFGKDGNGVPRIKTYLESKERGLTPESIWFSEDVSTNENAKNQLKDLFDEISVFDTPKPVDLVKLLVQISSDDGIVLDFFAGSSVTAHAVIDLNKQDNGNRKFVLVQLPEPCDKDSEAFKAGYKTISDIGKERIRRVIKKINDEKNKEVQGTLPLGSDDSESAVLDLGFKVFKLDISNFKQWQKLDPSIAVEELEKQLELHIDHISHVSTPEDLLYEILLKAGYTPTEKIETKPIAGQNVFSVAGGTLLLCLEDNITKELIDAVAESEPLQFICLDSAFHGNDQLKANAVQTFAARNMQKEKHNQIIFKTV